MSPVGDLSGQVFGKWLVVSKAEKKGKHTRWICRCECGAEKPVYQDHLRSGASTNCNRHGASETRAWASWMAMRTRCSNQKHPKYRLYGGRGIKVCERWQKFENFFADMGERPEGYSLEREDGDKDYEPGNCKWATDVEQNNNKADNRKILYLGKVHSRKSLAEALGVTIGTVDYRLKVMGAKGKNVEYVHSPSFHQGRSKKSAQSVVQSR